MSCNPGKCAETRGCEVEDDLITIRSASWRSATSTTPPSARPLSRLHLHAWFCIERNKLFKPLQGPFPLYLRISQRRIASSLDGMQQSHVSVRGLRWFQDDRSGSYATSEPCLCFDAFNILEARRNVAILLGCAPLRAGWIDPGVVGCRHTRRRHARRHGRARVSTDRTLRPSRRDRCH